MAEFEEQLKNAFSKADGKGLMDEIEKLHTTGHKGHSLSKLYDDPTSDYMVRICYTCDVAVLFLEGENPQPKQED